MKNIWAYISVFLSGVVAAFFILFGKLKPVYNTEQKIGKLKQKGEGNEQTTKGEITIPGYGKEKAVSDKKTRRKERIKQKKLNRKNRKQ